jgi:hypothetical protein
MTHMRRRLAAAQARRRAHLADEFAGAEIESFICVLCDICG